MESNSDDAVDRILDVLECLHESGDAEPDFEPLWSTCKDLISCAYVPFVKDGNERPCEENDFENYKPDAERKFQTLKTVVLKIQDFPNIKLKLQKDFIISLILLCGEHNTGDLWTTSETVTLSREVLQLLCNLCGCKSIGILLTGGTVSDVTQIGPFFKPALLKLRPKLLKESWKGYPAAVVCYKWLLLQVKSPNLSDHLNIVLPTALIILDDYVPENRVCGIECIHHIVDNVSRTSLGWYGQGDVVYKALESILYVRDALLVRPLIKCMVTVLDKVEGGFDKEDKMFQWSRYDDTIHIVLQTMELEQHCDLRLAYIESLPSLLESMGPGLARWSKRLLRVIQEYMEVAPYSDINTAKHALLALQVYLKKCDARIPSHCCILVSMLLRMLYDVTSQKKTDVICANILSLIEECLTVVFKRVPNQCKIMQKDLNNRARFNSNFSDVIECVFRNISNEGSSLPVA